ncbi:MAG: CPBP family intramembrane metalloprotease [Oscillospiraceae bacterium]|nr:CPBP family intramembrane metalloprotease [Oscillospiraceae bacterium]
MNAKPAWNLIISAVSACILHALILNSPFNFYPYTSAIKIILFVSFPLVYFRISREMKLKDLFSVGKKKKSLLFSLALGGGVFAFIMLAFLILRQFLDSQMILGALENNGITSENFALVFIYIVFVNAALEELFFRGFVFLTLHKKAHKLFAHLFSALLFAVYHVAILNGAISIGMFVFCIFGLTVAGLIFNYLTVKCGNILGALIVHVSANLALNLIVLGYLTH